MTSIKCHPVPHVGIPFQPKISHNYTVPEPFTFEGRNKYIQQKKEEKVRQFFEEEKKVIGLFNYFFNLITQLNCFYLHMKYF